MVIFVVTASSWTNRLSGERKWGLDRIATGSVGRCHPDQQRLLKNILGIGAWPRRMRRQGIGGQSFPAQRHHLRPWVRRTIRSGCARAFNIMRAAIAQLLLKSR
jgi:hypothetical protein